MKVPYYRTLSIKIIRTTIIFIDGVDFDDNSHRWLIFKSSEKDINAFFNKTISLWQMITKNTTVFLIDLDDELNKNQILVTTIAELPHSYLPVENSFFKEEQYHAYATELKSQFLTNKARLINF